MENSTIYQKIKTTIKYSDFGQGQKEADFWVEGADFDELQKLGEGKVLKWKPTGTPILNIPQIENMSPEFKKGFYHRLKQHWKKFKKQELGG